MNTKRISKTKAEHLKEFPPLSDGKQGKVITKHFTNLPFQIEPNHYALLSWLVYQSNADNTLEYNTALLKQYEATVRITAKDRTKIAGKDLLNVSIPKIRESFEWLIKNSYLLPAFNDKLFLINPNLMFSKLYVNATFYKEWVSYYYEVSKDFNNWSQEALRCEIIDMAVNYCSHVNNNFKKRKKPL